MKRLLRLEEGLGMWLDAHLEFTRLSAKSPALKGKLDELIG